MQIAVRPNEVPPVSGRSRILQTCTISPPLINRVSILAALIPGLLSATFPDVFSACCAASRERIPGALLDTVGGRHYQSQPNLMRRLFTNPLLLLITALLFTAGYGHQIFGKYVPHHHGTERADLHHTDDGGGDDNDDQPAGDADHFAGHHCVVAVFSDFTLPLVGELLEVGEMGVIVEMMPEAVPPGIEVPPQLT